MLKIDNVYCDSIIVVSIKDVVNDFDVAFAAKVAPEVTLLVCL